MTAIKMGTSQIRVTATKNKYRIIFTVRGTLFRLGICFLPRYSGEVERDKHQADDKDDNGNGGAVAHSVVVKGLNVHKVSQYAGLIVGSAAGHNRNQIEGAQGVDDADNYYNHRDRGQLRHEHVEKALYCTGTVYFRSIQQILVNALEAGQVEYHHVAHLTPDGHGYNRLHHNLRIAEPA